MNQLLILGVVGAMAAMMPACKYERSNVTGWEYNNQKNGGFQKVPYIDQETGPGLVLIEGGTFTMGRNEQDVTYEHNNVPRRVTVSSFYIDQTEVTNFNWLEYLYWIKRTYVSFPMLYRNALPDTLVWRSPLAFNEPYVEYYLRHPAYRDYPVVGVSWIQANEFCKWRTDRVNEYILIREGIMQMNPMQQDNPFTTEAYYAGQYEENVGRKLPDLNPSNPGSGRGRDKFGERNVRMEDGILLPNYRLPTEAEWEFAYYGLIGNMQNPGSEVISDRRTYPWTGHWVRQDEAKFQGQIRANFVRGRGDYMGVAGALNDGADVTAPVDAYWPNDYGLYNMAGNVSEWVMDVYRPLSHEDFAEFRPFRGNVFKTKVLNNQGQIDLKHVDVIYDVHGIKEYINEFERVRFQRITSKGHDPQDSVIETRFASQVKSRNPVETREPDPYYLSHGKSKDSLELRLLAQINVVLDEAIRLKNDKFPVEASRLIKDQIFDGIFEDFYRESFEGEQYTLDILAMLRDGMSEFILDEPGRLKYREVTAEENINRRNYKHADYIDHLDGDLESSQFYNDDKRKNNINEGLRDEDLVMYQNKFEEVDLNGTQIKPGRVGWPTTLVSDESRVYKGGSWADRAYWIVGGARRHLDQDQASAKIGFRCAMDRVGSPKGLGSRQ